MLRVWLGNADALLLLDNPFSNPTSWGHLTFSITFELNFCRERPAMEPMKVSQSGWVKLCCSKSTAKVSIRPHRRVTLPLTDILQDIVAKRIRDKLYGAARNGSHQLSLLLTICMVNAALDDTASVSVCANCDTVCRNCVDDELDVGGEHLVEALLNDVIAVEVLDHLHNMISQSFDDDRNLDMSASGRSTASENLPEPA